MRSSSDRPVEAKPHDLIVDVVHGRALENGILAHLRVALDRLPSHSVVVFLLESEPTELPLVEINRIAESIGCELLDVAQLAYPAWPTALVVGRDTPSHETQSFRTQLATLVPTTTGTVLPDIPPPLEDGEEPPIDPQERERLRRIELEQQLKILRTSLSLRVGSTLLGVARRPYQAPLLPYKLAKVWKTWRRTSAARDAMAIEVVDELVVPESLTVAENAHLLDGFGDTDAGKGRMEIWGVVTDAVALALSGHAALSRLLPHEVRLAFELGSPEVVLIQAKALLPAGPWAHAATPGGAVEYTKALHDLIALANHRNVPVVVLHDVPSARVPALTALTKYADFVFHGGDASADALQWSPGVPLEQFRPTEKTITDKVLILDEDEGRVFATPAARTRQELESTGLASVCHTYTPGLLDLIRQHDVVLSSPFDGHRSSLISDFTLGALASGARVVSGVNDSLLAMFPSAVFPIIDPADASQTIKSLLRKAGLGESDRRHNLRRIFDSDATPVRLAWLASVLGLEQDPLADRHVTALLRLSDGEDPGPTLDGLLRQTERPQRLIISAARISDRALDEVYALGMTATVVPPDQDWSTMASQADTTWVTVWDHAGTRTRQNFLKDLLVAAECFPADAVGEVGHAASDAAYGQYLDSLPLRRALVRRDLLLQVGPCHDLSVLSGPGARLFGVNYSGAA